MKNTHAPLVSQELWEIVQEVRQHKRRPPKYMEEPNLFSGLVYRSDCGKYTGVVPDGEDAGGSVHFRCSTYGKRGKGRLHTPHQIREGRFETDRAGRSAQGDHFARMKERQFAEYINQKNTLELRRRSTVCRRSWTPCIAGTEN